MALQSDLININSAGTTRAEYDKSTIQTSYISGVENVRLVAGFSRKGIFNRPIMINSASQFVSMFGSIDRSLEKKGSYFHRTVLQALSAGPVLALNLHAYKDIISMTVPVTVYSETDESAEIEDVALNNIFDTSLFFEPSKDLFNKAVKAAEPKDGLYFANSATEPITLFVVKNSPEDADMYNYDVTLEDWYSNSYPEIVQEFLDSQDDDEFATTHKMSEFFYTVYAYKGDWTKSVPGKLKEFLNSNKTKYGSECTPIVDEETKAVTGYTVKIPVAKKSLITKMNEIPGVNLIGSWSGVTIPETQNKSGLNITLSKLVNDDVYTTNLLLSVPNIFYNDSEASELPTAVGIRTVAELPVGVVPSGKNSTEQNIAMNIILNTLREEPVNVPDGYVVNPDSGEIQTAGEGEEDDNIYGQTNLFRTLVDRQYVQWRYLVDGFGLGYEPSCKSVYSELCKKRQSAFSISNFPSAKNVTEFNTDKDTLAADYEALAEKMSYNDEIGLPNEEEGATFAGYYFPYVNIYDLGDIKSVPPAGLISNLFIQKYKSNTVYKPTAGASRGVISGVTGPEVGLIKEDRSYLEPMGINSIIFEQGVGTEVYGNKTAKQTPVSSLSSINCRETCIYILDQVESITKNFVFEINDAQTRLKIWTQVDNMLKALQAQGGIYDYTVVMDESNNTPEIIDNLFGIIDISVECAKAMEKIHSRLNILKTGAIAAGEF